MGKKDKPQGPNVSSTANRDIMQRMNFLYQASLYLQSIDPSGSDSSSTTGTDKMDVDKAGPTAMKAKRSFKRRRQNMVSTGDLSRGAIHCMKVVGQKTTVKMDPNVKRSLCSSCDTPLVNGSSSSLRVKRSASHGHILVYTCLHCRTTKRIPAPPSVENGIQVDSEDGPQPDPSKTAGMEGKPPRKSSKKSRQPPFFARKDLGHVVFCGNERVSTDSEHETIEEAKKPVDD